MSEPTKIMLPGSTGREDLRKQHDFTLGETVRLKKRPDTIGTVAKVPAQNSLIVAIGTHILGNSMGVDLLQGGRAVADVDEWERFEGAIYQCEKCEVSFHTSGSDVISEIHARRCQGTLKLIGADDGA